MKNKITHPVLIIWFTLFLLFLLSFVKLPVIPYLNNYSSIDILQDIKDSKTPHHLLAKKRPAPIVAPGRTLPIAANIIDSSLITDYAADSATTMQTFFQKLENLKHKKGKVRIAYFGDSFIEADYVTGELRTRLQRAYGGNGVGFIPVQSIVADSYESIHFNKNNTWNDYNFRNNPKKLAVGLTGHVFYSNGDAWCEYGASNSKFAGMYLYTGKTQDTNTVITVDKDGVKNKIAVNNDAYINQTV